MNRWRVALSSLVVAWSILGQPQKSQADERQDYRELAEVLSQDYLLSNAEVAPEAEEAQQAVERLASSSEKAIVRGAGLFAHGMGVAEKKRAEAQRASDEIKRGAQERLEYYDYDADGRIRRNEIQGIENWARFATDFIAAHHNPEQDPAVEAAKRRIALDGTRARAWDELLPEVAEKLAGPPAKQPFVKIEFLADGPGGRTISSTTPRAVDTLPGRSTFLGRYVARNVAPKDLHNVTLAVEMYHYSTLPEATLRHVYFVPQWSKGATLELSRTFLPDVKMAGKKYNVPALERRADGGGFALASELSMMAGVVRMQAAVYCDEARQPPTKVELPERARIVAERLVKLAEEQATSMYAVTPAKTIPNPSPFAPKPGESPASKTAEEKTQFMLERLLRPVLAFMPASADVTKRADRLLKDFKSVREELLAKKEDKLLAVCEVGKRYTGTWSGPAVTGEFGLLFISCDAAGKRIRAEVFNPSKPEQRRLVAGFIAKDRKTLSNMIMLEPLYPNKGVDTGRPDEMLLHQTIKSYRFRLGDGILVGEASDSDLVGAAYDPQRKPMSLKEADGDPNELAEAKKRNEAVPRTQPREPLTFDENNPRGRSPATAATSTTGKDKAKTKTPTPDVPNRGPTPPTRGAPSKTKPRQP